MKSMNEHIASMISTLIDTSVKTNKQDEKIKDISYKFSSDEDCIDKIINKETHL